MDKLCEVPAGWRRVLVIEAATTDFGDLAALLDHVRECLVYGVLVLPNDCTWGLEPMPENLLAAVCTDGCPAADDLLSAPGLDPDAAPEPPPEPASPVEPPPLRAHDAPVLDGHCAGEKQIIQARLKAYRESHGLGCWKAVAKASRGKLTEDMLRDMSMGSVALPIAEWRLAAKALDKVEERKNEGA